VKHLARKRFGQHFLTDTTVVDGIVRAIDPAPGQALIEIGPGLGAMTRPLLDLARSFTVIELDRDLAARLRRWPGLEVIEADVLTVDFRSLADRLGSALRVVGNLPYNISSPILFHLLDVADRVQDQHFMLQKEVVDRMVAGPGSKTYGRLSVMLQWRYGMESVFDVAPEAFNPPPAVDSAVVRMTPLAHPPGIDVRTLSEIVTVAFSQRRKILRHTLGAWLAQKNHTGTFDTQRRAEEVPVQEYVALAEALA
jgi:16S rRNA (adenine1518-N6/adenine1519-N6)-dimethyltransferase